MASKRFVRLVWYEAEIGKEEHVARTADGTGDTFYLQLLDHPHESAPGISARTIDLHWLIDDYDGPRLALDLDKNNRPIGIEILYPSSDDEETES